MKRGLIGLIVVLGVLAALPRWTTVTEAQRPPVVGAGLRALAQARPSVRVIVQVAVDVKPDASLSEGDRAAQRQAINAAQNSVFASLPPSTKLIRTFEAIPFMAIEVTTDGLDALDAAPGVVTVQEDRLSRPTLAQSVPLIQAPTAWSAGYTGAGWTVAVLDTGVDKFHPFFGGRVVSEMCYSGNSNCPNGQASQVGSGAGVHCTYAGGCLHGTHVAGIAAGNNGSFAGVAPGAGIIAAQVFSMFTGPANCGGGEDPCALSYSSDQIAALQQVYNLRTTFQIASVNMSLGGGQYFDQASCDADDPATLAAINLLKSVGIATIIASGNNGFTNSMSSPGCLSSAVSVGSTTKFDDVSSFSNSVSFLKLLAPGSDITSSVPSGAYQSLDGTSMATPHVAGAWAIAKQRVPASTVDQVLAAFQASNTYVTDTRNGLSKPRIEVNTAINCLAGTGPCPGPPGPDAFEPDNSPAQASTLTSGVPQSHTLLPGTDVDWAVFSALAGQQYTIETSALGSGVDTWIYLYAANGTTLLANNDDIDPGVNVASRIIYNATVNGPLYVKVDRFSPSSDGAYTLNLTGAGGGGTPDIRIQPTNLTFTPTSTRQIFVEIDWMETAGHSHRPSQTVIDAIVATFAREGYTITIDVSNAVPHQDVLNIPNSGNNTVVSSAAEIQAIKASHFNHAADSRYYYSLWGHTYSFAGGQPGSSGISDLPGETHLVTLGTFSGQTGTQTEQIGTFMHEFGHSIGQTHGGTDHGNFKPNYISIMNYHYQLGSIGPSLLALQYANTGTGFNTFGYSHGLLPSLNESNLNESLGIGLGRAVDWNCNGSIQSSVAKDISDNANHCAANGALSTIADFDNWTSINSFIQLDPPRPAADAPKFELCIRSEEAAAMRDRIAALRAQGAMPSETQLIADTLRVPVGPAATASAQFFDVFNDGTGTLSVSGITLDTPAAFVTWEPQSFAVPAGGSQRVHVYVNYQLLPGGQSTRRLLVASNDPDENPYPNAVNLTMGQGSPPGAFTKSTPGNTLGHYGTTLQFAWTASAGATNYELCIDTTNDNACSSWNAAGLTTAVTLSGLTPNTTYYWHVRATNGSGTTYSNGAATSFHSFSTGPNQSMFYNSSFSDGTSAWQTFDTPSGSMASTVSAGVFHFMRTGTQAVIFQNSGLALGTSTALQATFALGNTDTTRKRISVLLHDADFTDLHVCTFWLPAGQPLALYSMRTHTTKAWTNATVSFYAASTNAPGNLTGWYQLDNVAVLTNPAVPVTETTCIDPNAPAAPGGAPSANLVGNGDFSAGLAPWSLFGQISGAVNGGVFEFIKLAGSPAGVILQNTGQAMVANQIVTASLQFGNSSGVRKRVTAILHDADFSDLAACTFWLSPGQALGTHAIRFYTTKAWANATVSVYPATVGSEQWIRLDNVVLQRTPANTLGGASVRCVEPGGALPDAPLDAEQP